jgi:hypothetical protein
MQAPFLALLGGDFSGKGNFFYWVLAIVAIGAIGYLPKAKPVSDGLLVLIILALFLAVGKPGSNGGVFGQLTAALTDTQHPSAASITGSGVSSVVGQVVSGVTGG